MTVSDNGVGFETQKVYELKGIGFLNMLQRAKLLNGTLDIQSKPLSGCKIILRVADINDLVQDPASGLIEEKLFNDPTA
jgi:signal transduction histidine kinase